MAGLEFTPKKKKKRTSVEQIEHRMKMKNDEINYSEDFDDEFENEELNDVDIMNELDIVGGEENTNKKGEKKMPKNKSKKKKNKKNKKGDYDCMKVEDGYVPEKLECSLFDEMAEDLSEEDSKEVKKSRKEARKRKAMKEKAAKKEKKKAKKEAKESNMKKGNVIMRAVKWVGTKIMNAAKAVARFFGFGKKTAEAVA